MRPGALCLMLSMLGKNFSQWDILKYSPRKMGFDSSCKLSPKETRWFCMKCQKLFARENKKIIINLSSVQFAQRMLKFKTITLYRVLLITKGKSLKALINKVKIWAIYSKNKSIAGNACNYSAIYCTLHGSSCAKTIFRHRRTVKAQISLHICAVWSGLSHSYR